MASSHISLPKPFATGDAVEWFQRFEICSRANEWNDNKKALKLPTLLEGEALAVWVELTDEEQKDYAATKKKIIDAIMPMQFVSLADFHKQMLLPGESLSMYVHQLKQLLNQAMPDIPTAAKEQLLLHQFLSGLPQEVSKQLRATGTATTLTDAVERAKLLMTIEHREVAATTKQPEFLQLQQQLSDLSEQVAAMSFHTLGKYQGRARGEVRRCFICNKTGHLQHACPTQRPRQDARQCFKCNKPGHLWKNCPQGNERGAAVWGSSRPNNH